jgi:hypothetical protein
LDPWRICLSRLDADARKPCGQIACPMRGLTGKGTVQYAQLSFAEDFSRAAGTAVDSIRAKRAVSSVG